MAIVLTEQEKALLKEGKLDVHNILEHRKLHPVRTIDANQVEDIKKQIRQVMQEYRDSIQKNKDLYNELVVNRKNKEVLRNKLADLRVQKKKLLGLI